MSLISAVHGPSPSGFLSPMSQRVDIHDIPKYHADTNCFVSYHQEQLNVSTGYMPTASMYVLLQIFASPVTFHHVGKSWFVVSFLPGSRL